MEIVAYQEKLNEFLRRIPDCMYVFEITKTCGYGEFVMLYKNASLMDLYKSASICYGTLHEIDKLYFINEKTQEKVLIPNANNLSIKQLIASTQMPATMRPIYAIPAPAVYRIYYDDGHYCCEK